MKRYLLVKLMLTFLFSLILLSFLFSASRISPFAYLLLLVVSILMIFIVYSEEGNFQFYKNFSVGITGNILACIAYIIINYAEISQNCNFPEYCQLLLYIALCFEIFYSVERSSDSGDWTNAAVDTVQRPQLFGSRKRDLAKLKTLLAYSPIVGVNSVWGNGKSFLVDYYCAEKETQEQYYIIKIDLLALRYGEFDKILITKLDDLLRDNHVFSFYAIEALRTMGTNLWGRLLYHFFRGNDFGNASTFAGLKKDLERLPKKVLIVFEDIERIDDKAALKKLFAIVERLAGSKVQVIYEYDLKRLADAFLPEFMDTDKVNGKRKDASGRVQAYLEKYIPVELNVTPLSYRNITAALWDELHMDALGKWVRKEDQSTISLKDFTIRYVYTIKSTFPSNQKPKLAYHLAFGSRLLSVRRIRNFLLEIKSWMKNYPDTVIPVWLVRTVFAYYFLKYFAYPQYEKLRPMIRLDKIFPFTLNGKKGGKKLTIPQLYLRLWYSGTSRKDISVKAQDYAHSKYIPIPAMFHEALQKQLHMGINRKNRMVYSLFPYPVDDYEMVIEHRKSRTPYTPEEREFMQVAQRMRHNVDQEIWKLVRNDQS